MPTKLARQALLAPLLLVSAASAVGDVEIMVTSGQSVAGDPLLSYAQVGAGTLNDFRQFTFSARLAGPGVTSDNDSASFFFDGTTARLFLREGDAAPDGPGTFAAIGSPASTMPATCSSAFLWRGRGSRSATGSGSTPSHLTGRRPSFAAATRSGQRTERAKSPVVGPLLTVRASRPSL